MTGRYQPTDKCCRRTDKGHPAVVLHYSWMASSDLVVGMEFFARIRKVCSHAILRKQSLSQSLPHFRSQQRWFRQKYLPAYKIAINNT